MKKAAPEGCFLHVIPLGFEPKTHSLEGCCSIQLSYGTILLELRLQSYNIFLGMQASGPCRGIGYFTREMAPKTPREAASMMTPASRTPRVT